MTDRLHIGMIDCSMNARPECVTQKQFGEMMNISGERIRTLNARQRMAMRKGCILKYCDAAFPLGTKDKTGCVWYYTDEVINFLDKIKEKRKKIGYIKIYNIAENITKESK